MSRAVRNGFLALLCCLPWPGAAAAASYDPSPAWPLCGRIAENPPANWQATDGCPAERFGNSGFSDEPINSTFGPRPLDSESDRYDFHRGIDLSTPIGTPVFAIADGVVRIAGVNPAFEDPVVEVRHLRPGQAGCSPEGCYHATYLHMSSVVVAANEAVVKGQLLGYTGASHSGYEHLHFEIRDAVPEDPFSSWQRDAINPLFVLPYAAPDTVTVTYDAADTSTPGQPRMSLTVESPRADIYRVEVALFNAAGREIAQPGNTVDAHGYNVDPSFFDTTVWNRQYTHKDSSAFPWESFGVGGANECPYAGDHPASYTAVVHLDQADPMNPMLGLFNGLRIEPSDYGLLGSFRLRLSFLALVGDPACIVTTVRSARGGAQTASWGNCGAKSPGGVAALMVILNYLLGR